MAEVCKMGAREAIRVHVCDDGDVELQKHDMTTPLRMLYPSDILFYNTDVINERLDRELISYGCDPDRVKEAIEEVINADYLTTIIV